MKIKKLNQFVPKLFRKKIFKKMRQNKLKNLNKSQKILQFIKMIKKIFIKNYHNNQSKILNNPLNYKIQMFKNKIKKNQKTVK